jgi:hypothetical protein
MVGFGAERVFAEVDRVEVDMAVVAVVVFGREKTVEEDGDGMGVLSGYRVRGREIRRRWTCAKRSREKSRSF